MFGRLFFHLFYLFYRIILINVNNPDKAQVVISFDKFIPPEIVMPILLLSYSVTISVIQLAFGQCDQKLFICKIAEQHTEHCHCIVIVLTYKTANRHLLQFDCLNRIATTITTTTTSCSKIMSTC